MSRFVITAKCNRAIMHCTNSVPVRVNPKGKEEHTLSLVFGYDPPMGGLFFQLWETEEGAEEEKIVVNQSSLFDGVSKSHIMELIEYYADDAEKRELKSTIFRISMDLPF